MHLSKGEGRLIAVRRAIEKFNNPDIIGIADASSVCIYITELIDIESVEDIADEKQLEYFLDGIIVGMATSRLLDLQVPVENLPKSKQEAAKQFQTGVDSEGKVRVNT